MKSTLLTLLAVCVLSSAAAFAQWSYINPEAHPVVIPSHEQHAFEGSLRQEGSLYVRTATAVAQGERPLWEVAHPAPEVPLGDIARLYRQQHATAKKAVKVLEK